MTTEIKSRFRFDAKEHHYFIDSVQVPSVTSVLADNGFIDDKYFTEESRKRGEIVHAVTAHLDRGLSIKWDTLHPDLQGYVESWLKFKKHFNLNFFDEIETPLYSPSYLFAGTPDRTATIDGKVYVLDLKTGAVPFWARYQTAAYHFLANMYTGIPPQYVTHRMAVGLKADGSLPAPTYYNDLEYHHDSAAFLSFLQTTQRRHFHGIGSSRNKS